MGSTRQPGMLRRVLACTLIALASTSCASSTARDSVASTAAPRTSSSTPASTSTTAAIEVALTPTTIDPKVLAPPPADPDRPGLMPTSHDFDVPNPFVVVREADYLMFSTNTDFFGVQMHVPYRYSFDLAEWSFPGEALPTLPAWAEPGWTWAPDVIETRSGFVLFFTARLAGTELQCIGHAVADRIDGPYTAFDTPIVCPTERGGAIDPRTFEDDDGSLWLLWKTDDNWNLERTDPASLMAAPLTSDATTLSDQPVELLRAGGAAWEGHIVEAPDLMRGPDGRLWLFYSGGWFNQPTYGIGVAQCESPAGPCTRRAGQLLSSNAQGSGPGEGSLFVDRDGSVWMAYAPWAQRYRTETPRPLALARIGFGSDGPYLGDPSR